MVFSYIYLGLFSCPPKNRVKENHGPHESSDKLVDPGGDLRYFSGMKILYPVTVRDYNQSL